MSNNDFAVDGARRTAVLARMLELLDEHHVLPETARTVRTAIEGRLADGAYDGITTAVAFCEAVTGHMLEVANDRHLRLRLRGPIQQAPSREEWLAEYRVEAALQNYGFASVERFPGNVGYLDLRKFEWPELGGDTAVAAMNFLANSSAVIFDMRQCRGGSPAMVALILSYVFKDPVHINGFQSRNSEVLRQSWTLPYVPGKRITEHPVWVLTSKKTFSGAEEFAYDIQTQKRGTLVGETTGGGANPGMDYPIDEQFQVFVATGRAVNPVRGDNWEGRGVQPDIAVPAADALKVAYTEALKQVLAQAERQSPQAWQGLKAEAEKALSDPGAALRNRRS